jgi:hypothetical protein
MKKTTFFAFLLAVTASAQTTYNSTDFATAGETVDLTVAGNFLTADFTLTGANQSWDYSALSSVGTDSSVWLDPEDSGYKTTWCLLNFYLFNCNSQFSSAFNLASQVTDGFSLEAFGVTNVIDHYSLSPTALEAKMIGVTAQISDTSLPFTIDYTSPDVVYQFPINFNDNYTNTGSLAVDLSTLGYPISISGTTQRTNLVDGWGQLTTPAATYASVLKMKTTLVTDQTVVYNGTTYPIQATTITYSWFDPAYSVPVLQVTGAEVGEVFVPATVTFIGQALGITHLDAFAGVSLFPNPTSGQLQLNTDIAVQQVDVFNTLGVKVGNSLNISGLENGIYFVKITTDAGSFTRKVVKK